MYILITIAIALVLTLAGALIYTAFFENHKEGKHE